MPMQFRIPFTETKLTIGTTPESQSRGMSRGRFSGTPERDLSGFKFDVGSLYTAWRNNGDVFGCVREIRQGTGIGGFYFYDPSDEKKEKPAASNLTKQLTDIMTYQYLTVRSFKDKVMEHRLISGNAYIEKIRNPFGQLIGLKVLDPRTMSVVSDEHGNVYRYIQALWDNGEKQVDPVIFEPKDIIHWKWGTDPNAEVFGFSAMEPVLWEVRTDLSAMISNYYFFENDAVPSVWYVLDEQMSDEEAKAAIQMIRDSFKGAKKRHKGGAMKGVKDIKTIRLSNQDMEFMVGRKFSTEKICAAYGVPKVMLGYTEGVNYTNHEGQMRIFHEGTVKEHELALLEMVNLEVVPELGNNSENRIAMGVMPASFDSDDMLWTRAVQARNAGLVTINGARRMVGKEPIDESVHGDLGDQIILGEGIGAKLLIDIGVDPYTPQDELNQLAGKMQKYDQTNRYTPAR